MESTRISATLRFVATVLLSLSVFTETGEAGRIPASKESNHLDAYMPWEDAFELCESHAIKGHCSYYSCLDDSLQCHGSKHNRSLAFRFCDRSRHHDGDFTDEGRAWAAKTNRCVLKTIATGREDGRGAWCSQVDITTKSALVECARSADICQVLWSDRQAIYKVFSSRSWFTAVEAARHCPRTTVNSYIFWTLGQMHIYKR